MTQKPSTPQSANVPPNPTSDQTQAPAQGPGKGPAQGAERAAVQARVAARKAAAAGGPAVGPEKGPSAAAGVQGQPPHRPAQSAAKPAASATPKRAAVPVLPPATAARPRKRHWWMLLGFILASTVAFSVRREEAGSAIESLIGFSGISGSSSSDTDILYEFLQSQRLVKDMDETVDLRGKWSKPDYDPFFAFDGTGSVEDLVDYWAKMVKIYYDSGAGLIEVRVLAFDPNDATEIANALFEKSADMINELSDIAREDTIRFARDELNVAIERLKVAREAVTRFRNLHQLVDPSVDLQTQAGLLGNLQAQLAEALIEVDLLAETTGNSDPRLIQTKRRVEVIQQRIEAERRKLGQGGQTDTGDAFADVVGEYERLAVDRQFAETSYTSTLAAYDVALADARRKSRYLAAHVKPTTAETSRYPDRLVLVSMIGLFLVLFWATVVLVVYSLRDRR